MVFRVWSPRPTVSAITWELVRAVNSQAYSSELLEAGPSTCALTSPPGDSDAQKFEEHWNKLCHKAAGFDGDVTMALRSKRANEETVAEESR